MIHVNVNTMLKHTNNLIGLEMISSYFNYLERKYASLKVVKD